jgi:1,4-dihydroxy-6-naphthoate synthase
MGDLFSVHFRHKPHFAGTPTMNRPLDHSLNHPQSHPLTLGFSPCPNDTFVFYALVHGKINLHPFCSPLDVDFFLADVEELNRRAASGEPDICPDICKVSARAAAHLLDRYVVLRTGGATGYGCGPVLVARNVLQPEELRKAVVAVPGAQTTAAFLLGLNGLHQGPLREIRYDRIMGAVVSGEVDAGLLIHEERFTYEEHGLRKVLDLGEWWETAHGLPLPLGVVVMKRELGMKAILATEQAIRASLDHARREPESAMPFVREHAQNMEPEILRLHIETFVNDFTRELGPVGENAIRELFALVLKSKDQSTGCESIFPGE